ncbi:FecR family protein [Reichenbachiella faecimaris]|uniref:FecR family protein n=1 Tax=Reichenbachiella faecimaris TaxID=692418 RepID=A0A1W2GMN1_REIFA|nr:FecR domain-containing protein [Reichenbachiella faecimaris]SMD37923.1 FecR family protein [Reichenbachiella faecimaris]
MQELEFKILAYIKGELSENEQLQVEQWVAQSDANQQVFNEIEKIYLSSELNTSNFTPDVDSAWNTVISAIDQSNTSGKSMLYRIAVMITLVVGLGLIAFQYQNQDDLHVARTSDNEIKKIELADGTVVWLNENSVFSYPQKLSGDERVVELVGQAYFEVAKDPQRPFRILGEQTAVEVLGTSFDFISRTNYSNINVTSGIVAFELIDNDEIKVVLEKGTQATYKSNQLIKNEGFDENASSWMTKDFVFKSSPLSVVVEKLSQHFDVKIKVDDAIKNCLITSSFENKELDEILDTLEAIANIKNEKKGKTIKLTGPGC